MTGKNESAGNGRSSGNGDAASPERGRQIAHIGEVLRNARHGRCTIEELAARSGVSSGSISLLERGQGNPSIVTLQKLAQALDLHLGALFEGGDGNGLVIRWEDARELSLAHEGLTYHLLTPLHSRLVVHRTQVTKAAGSAERPFTHPGEECIHVLKGEMEVVVGGTSYSLSERDSITFDSSIPHWFTTRTGADIIGSMTPPHGR